MHGPIYTYTVPLYKIYNRWAMCVREGNSEFRSRVNGTAADVRRAQYASPSDSVSQSVGHKYKPSTAAAAQQLLTDFVCGE